MNWRSGVVSAAMALMVGTLVPDNDASAAERVVKKRAERSSVAASRRAERQARREVADRPVPAESPAAPPAKKPAEGAKDDSSWVSIYPAEQ